ncbi:MAG: ankyrin repeat domain-containing protein [Elusimicrobia bacterium]|nr:ankyrin repeat domain-containing protein [Elusimicrobiota bacterium]
MRKITPIIRTALLCAAALGLAACELPDNTPGLQLASAIRNGDAARVRELVAAGAPVNISGPGWSPLMLAVMQDNGEMVDILVGAGADINARTKDLATPVSLAARWGKFGALERLLKAGVNTEPRDMIGWTPLMWAALRGKDRAVELLVKGGANINAEDSDGNTPVMLAVSRGHRESALTLVEGGADLSHRNRFGQDAALLALKSGFPGLASEISGLGSGAKKKRR